jgi:hypothetical protein
MGHWAERYVGRAYVRDEFECGELAQLVNREVFGREIRLPSERPYRGKSGHARYKAMVCHLAAVKDDYGLRTDNPEEGDCVLLLSRGRPSHIGVYCRIKDEAWVLHCASNAREAVLHRIRALPQQGLAVEGYYRWI